MSFNNLTREKIDILQQEILDTAMSMGGKNHFLQMINDIKASAEHPLSHQSCNFNFMDGRITWSKAIYKKTLNTLFKAIRAQEKEGILLDENVPKEYKNRLNMIKTLKPVEITIKAQDSDAFNCKIFNIVDGDKTEVNTLFKVIFFYNIDFVKKILNNKI